MGNMIDKIYFIFLDKEDRIRNVNGQIKAHSLSNYILWPAINAKFIGIQSTRRFTSGMYGCYLSHTQVWKEAIRLGYKRIMVIEDDCTLKLRFKNKLEDALKVLPEDFDFAMIGNYIQKENKIIHVNDIWCKNNNWFGTHCYIVNLENVSEKIKLFEVMRNQIDLQIRDLNNVKKVNTYLLKEPIANQIGLPTTVQKVT